ncbi:FAD:protein FMN transferase [Roseibium sp.]|uniref:FAD:protein FMN transferase n=1 Tax=Roseibium sp. TaxID=1936156 RepID=UPI003BA9A233
MTCSSTLRRRINRRRFLRICAIASASACLPSSAPGANQALQRWTGTALGAPAEINLLGVDGEKARALFRLVDHEIRRLEGIFSLFRDDSELVRLNKDGCLKAPSLEFIELLGTVRLVHRVSDGAFDPTVQPLWIRFANGTAPQDLSEMRAFADAASRTGFAKVRFDPSQIRYEKSGMAMTLNGIAQGYITDRVTALLEARGCRNVVVDLGEISARGGGSSGQHDDNGGWSVTLRPDPAHPSARTGIRLKDAAVASSARLGTTLDREGNHSHILDPRSGHPVNADLIAASVIAPSAALADGVSTAALVTGRKGLGTTLSQLPATKAFVVREDGTAGWM